MPTYAARAATTSHCTLGEGPAWDEAGGRVLWVDIPTGRAYEGALRDDGVDVTRVHQLADTVGAAAPAIDGGLIVAARDGFAAISPEGVVVRGPRVLPAGAHSRLNDGACDPAGRFLAGSLALDGRERQERLYRLEVDGRATVIADGLTLSNGLGWSPDGRTMYHIDSVPGIIWGAAYDAASGESGDRRELFRVVDAIPDGMCVDTDGCLWIAIWGGGQVRRYTPMGDVLATVEVAAPNTTSAAFVGPERDRLLITTAREQLSEAQLAAYPDAGALFLADVAATGVPRTPWSGDTRRPPWARAATSAAPAMVDTATDGAPR